MSGWTEQIIVVLSDEPVNRLWERREFCSRTIQCDPAPGVLMDLGLAGARVQSVLVDYTLRMHLSGGYFIVAESVLSIHRHGESITVSPEEVPLAFEPVQRLVGQVVDEAIADESGALRVLFGDGTRLDVEPDSSYEAWNVSGPRGLLVVCTPGGELVRWTPKEGADMEDE